MYVIQFTLLEASRASSCFEVKLDIENTTNTTIASAQNHMCIQTGFTVDNNTTNKSKQLYNTKREARHKVIIWILGTCNTIIKNAIILLVI